VLIPGSAFPQQAQYQALANRLPAGEVLVVLPTAQHPEWPLLETIVALWRARGRLVRTVTTAASTSANPRQTTTLSR
jgi:hypothetical protein